jgi:hypothetical protein
MLDVIVHSQPKERNQWVLETIWLSWGNNFEKW